MRHRSSFNPTVQRTGLTSTCNWIVSQVFNMRSGFLPYFSTTCKDQLASEQINRVYIYLSQKNIPRIQVHNQHLMIYQNLIKENPFYESGEIDLSNSFLFSCLPPKISVVRYRPYVRLPSPGNSTRPWKVKQTDSGISSKGKSSEVLEHRASRVSNRMVLTGRVRGVVSHL